MGSPVTADPGSRRSPWTYLNGAGQEIIVSNTWQIRIRPRIDGGPGVMLDTYSAGSGLSSIPLPPDVFAEMVTAYGRFRDGPAAEPVTDPFAAMVLDQTLAAFGLKAWQLGLGPAPRLVRWTRPLRRAWYAAAVWLGGISA